MSGHSSSAESASASGGSATAGANAGVKRNFHSAEPPGSNEDSEPSYPPSSVHSVLTSGSAPTAPPVLTDLGREVAEGIIPMGNLDAHGYSSDEDVTVRVDGVDQFFPHCE